MRALLLIVLAGCGGNAWVDADTQAAHDAVRAQAMLERVCEDDGGCSPGMVRAVERATACNLGSMLCRHAGECDAGRCGP